MELSNDTPAPTKPLMAGCQQEPCSPSSLTPETDEAWKAVSRTPDGMYDSRVPISAFAYGMSRHSEKMEQERNAAYAKIRDCVARLDACADGYAETRDAIADLAAILPENVTEHPTADSEAE